MKNFEQRTRRDVYFKLLAEENRQLLDKKTGLLSKKYSKKIDCPLCHYKKYHGLFIKNGYTFVRCLRCTLVYVNPQIDQTLIHNLYKKSRASDLWAKIMSFTEEKKWKTEYYNGHIKLINKYTTRSKTKRLLDVGCGMGHFMEIANRDGWQVEGIELNKRSVEYIKKKYGFRIYQEEIRHAPLKDDHYDVITMYGILEHLNDPFQAVKTLYKKLKKGGILMAITPNVHSLYSLFLRDKSNTFDGRNHLIYFSPKTLHKLFADSCFKITLLDTVLSGMENIMKYIQFYDPYKQVDNLSRYLPDKIRFLFNDREKFEKRLKSYDLGLRLRIIARR